MKIKKIIEEEELITTAKLQLGFFYSYLETDEKEYYSIYFIFFLIWKNKIFLNIPKLHAGNSGSGWRQTPKKPAIDSPTAHPV